MPPAPDATGLVVQCVVVRAVTADIKTTMTNDTLKQKLREEFDEKFLPSSLKWKDVVHCTCCSTEQEYAEIKDFLDTAIDRAVQEERKHLDEI